MLNLQTLLQTHCTNILPVLLRSSVSCWASSFSVESRIRLLFNDVLVEPVPMLTPVLVMQVVLGWLQTVRQL